MDPRVRRWLYLAAALTFALIVFGGFVRLTRSGLSIVEWNPVTGVIPPVGERAWTEEFAKYQQTPEYRTVNFAMTLPEYQRIFFIEYTHRLIARLAGLAIVVPLAVFLWRGSIPWRRSGLFLGIAALFGLQGFLGWFMVSSGLLDQPSVSHYRLTIHLLTAMVLLALTTRAALDGEPLGRKRVEHQRNPRAAGLAWLLLTLVTVQIAWGGLVAGLKAGHVSHSWPLMAGSLLPDGLFARGDGTWWSALTNHAPAVHWIHRWFAFVVLAGVVWLAAAVRREPASWASRRAVQVIIGLAGVQVALGIGVILFHVPVSLALLHQAVGLALFVATLVAAHHLGRG